MGHSDPKRKRSYINNNININNHINRAILGFPNIQCFVHRVQTPRGKAMSGECTHDGLTCFHFAPTAGRICGNPDCGFRYGSCTNKNRCAICMFEEQGPDACLCERNIALVREARVQQLLSRHWQDRPAPARLPDDLREIWNDKEALKARSNEPIVVASRALEQRPRPKSKMPGRVALGLGPLVTEEGYTSRSSDSRDTAERSKEAAVAQDALARRVQVSE